MEKVNYRTSSYRMGDYQVDLVVTEENNNKSYDVWLGHIGGAMKLYLFNIKAKNEYRVVNLVYRCLMKDDRYTSALDELDIYVRE